MNNEIKVLGTEEINGNQFTGIEGGFGEGKRSMLVRDIAEANRTTTKKLNQNIERNRKRFKDEVDLIDLNSNSVVTHSDLEKMGFSQNAINRSSNIYLLSERGYAKLLKIMDSDEAWEQYDKFVDGYFQYREAVRGYQAEPQYKLPQNYSEALRELANSTDKIAGLQPKAELHDKFIATGGAIGIREASAELGIKMNEFTDLLMNHGYIYRQRGRHGKLQPIKKYVPKLFQLKSGGLDENGIEYTPQMKITPYGREFFYKKFINPE
ncbi:phage antirepressor KilAC domain-containing protein [Weissella minor]|uniref:phage antirepressor KilAC domain-containing protein n=1 Tax=Weissella minor TaxID=1620 RepID=UPI001BAEACBA|nr:phage antirepressor KilAC domain-containing protein [Weissella minor]MBS0950371.1 phage antirepressor KilAC domain-containing protein [Weissella minor]